MIGGSGALGAVEETAVAEAAEQTVAPVACARNLAWWDANVAATAENERRRAETELAYSNALADRELFGAVEAARKRDSDGLLRRRLDLLHNLMLPRQVPASLRERIVELEASVEARFSRHRGVVLGQEVDDIAIKRILRESDDVDQRREAWEASKTVGAEVAGDVRELARLRNESARALGYRDWFALWLGRDIVELGRRTFDGIGIDVGETLSRSDLFPRAGKNQHAFCLDVDRAGDIRVLANVTDNHDSMTTLLHELGHAVFDLGLADDLPWVLRNTHLVTTEASALLFGALAGQREWLEGVLGLEGDEAASLEGQLEAARGAELLLFTRWVLVMTGFERQLYADPEADLDSLWWELVSRHQLVTPPAGRRAPDWAAKIHVAVAPVYYHTYLYGSIVASQLHDVLRSEAGAIVNRPESGRLLAERLFAPGLSKRWDRLVQQVTGSPLSVDALEREVAAAIET